MRMRRMVPLVLAVVALSAAPSPASASWERSNFSYSSSDCRKEKASDPVGVVFYGTAAYEWYMVGHIRWHTGWRGSHGARQWIRDEHQCDPTDFGASSGKFSRFHIRIWQKASRYKGVYTTVGTPHHEDFTYCGHAVDKGTKENPTSNGSGFDWGRRELVAKFRTRGARHRVTDHYWGNTRSFKQCDGDWAGSNGNVAWIQVGRFNP